MLSKNDDYSYVQTFIDFLEQIIDMIVKLFSSLGSSSAPAEGEEAE